MYAEQVVSQGAGVDHGWMDLQEHLGTLWLQVVLRALPGDLQVGHPAVLMRPRVWSAGKWATVQHNR